MEKNMSKVDFQSLLFKNIYLYNHLIKKKELKNAEAKDSGYIRRKTEN